MLLLALILPVASQDKTVYGSVRSLDQKPVARTEIRTNTGASDVTTDSGRFGLPLVPPLKPGYPVVFSVTGWAVVDPCVNARGRTYLPDPGADEISITALKLGDSRLLSTNSVRCIIVQKAARFARRPAPPSNLKFTVSSNRWFDKPDRGGEALPSETFATYQSPALVLTSARVSSARNPAFPHRVVDSEDQTDGFLQEQADALGVPVQAISGAIFEWSKSATDPYDQGLIAFYDGRYSDASRLIQESIEASPKGSLERLVTLARTEYEQKHYDAAREALLNVLKQHPDDPLLLENLAVIDNASKQAQ